MDFPSRIRFRHKQPEMIRHAHDFHLNAYDGTSTDAALFNFCRCKIRFRQNMRMFVTVIRQYPVNQFRISFNFFEHLEFVSIHTLSPSLTRMDIDSPLQQIRETGQTECYPWKRVDPRRFPAFFAPE